MGAFNLYDGRPKRKFGPLRAMCEVWESINRRTVVWSRNRIIRFFILLYNFETSIFALN